MTSFSHIKKKGALQFISLVVFLSIFINSCSIFQPVNEIDPVVVRPQENGNRQAETTSSETSNGYSAAHGYKGSRTIYHELIHTKLDIGLDFEQESCYGNAEITLKPHYYSADTLQLDARGFEIEKISLLGKNKQVDLEYKYDNKIITVFLNKKYGRNDTFTISIDYTAYPARLPNTSKGVISDNRGLYFIDPRTDNPQVWTQGQVQANSAWFPTIDAPNQRMSQEIYLTVPKEFKTLSNGVLHNSLLNNDGTRTDHWKQEKPHPPYLVMIAVGRFDIIEDYRRDMPVFVYAEPEQTEKAEQLFEKTDKMINFFSDKLDYDYPWDKYHQIVVRNFISGAMENTTASVFGSYVLNFNNEDQRRAYENVVAHELAHHWFGNLVTCESWANLPLNESFATYFEYIWVEHEYGREYADEHLLEEFFMYRFESIFSNKQLIRFYHEHSDDMFDTHSYQKGSLILHYLRKIVGDEAFWDALELYLKSYENQAVEIHHLRLAFEKTTGEDLNWFFNQFFLNKGYPKLKVDNSKNHNDSVFSFTIEQTQSEKFAPVYRLPLEVDFYFPDTLIRKQIILDRRKQSFKFRFDSAPQFYILDAENALPGTISHEKTRLEYEMQLERAPLYIHKLDAFKYLSKKKPSKKLVKIYYRLLSHEFYFYRLRALQGLAQTKGGKMKEKLREKINEMAKNDPHPKVKQEAKKSLKHIKKSRKR